MKRLISVTFFLIFIVSLSVNARNYNYPQNICYLGHDYRIGIGNSVGADNYFGFLATIGSYAGAFVSYSGDASIGENKYARTLLRSLQKEGICTGGVISSLSINASVLSNDQSLLLNPLPEENFTSHGNSEVKVSLYDGLCAAQANESFSEFKLIDHNYSQILHSKKLYSVGNIVASLVEAMENKSCLDGVVADNVIYQIVDKIK
jgi:hypothetical protein